MNQATLDLLALSLTPGLGTVRIHKLLDRCGDPSSVLRMSRREMQLAGFSAEIQAYLLSGCACRDADETADEVARKGIRLALYGDPGYPALLKEIHDPPIVLYALGNVAALSLPSVAVVGSRRCSVYGAEVARRFGLELAQLGLSVVSGLARGIDSKAHAGALEGKGTTVAVMGTGVDVIYPKENRRLYREIASTGCVVSEFPLGTFPAPQNFPIRNRIISGLAFGTLIPEAAEFSGSLITARLTLEQDRELWAIPGNITNPSSYGPNHLIKQGARPVLEVQDIVDSLPLHVLKRLREQVAAREDSPESLSEEEKRVLKHLDFDRPVHFDELLFQASLNVTKLSEVLLNLELKGEVQQYPGRRFARRLK